MEGGYTRMPWRRFNRFIDFLDPAAQNYLRLRYILSSPERANAVLALPTLAMMHPGVMAEVSAAPAQALMSPTSMNAVLGRISERVYGNRHALRRMSRNPGAMRDFFETHGTYVPAPWGPPAVYGPPPPPPYGSPVQFGGYPW